MQPQRMQQPTGINSQDHNKQREGQKKMYGLEYFYNFGCLAAVEVVDVQDDPIDLRQLQRVCRRPLRSTLLSSLLKILIHQIAQLLKVTSCARNGSKATDVVTAAAAFFDEVQELPVGAHFLKRLFDTIQLRACFLSSIFGCCEPLLYLLLKISATLLHIVPLLLDKRVVFFLEIIERIQHSPGV